MVARIALFLAPDLAGGLEVPPEGGHARWRENGRVNAVTRARTGVEDAVRFGDEPADVGLLQNAFDALGEGAFRQPDAARLASETLAVMIARDENLRPQGGRVVGQQRQQRVGRGAGGDFQQPVILKFAERADKLRP